MNTFWLTISLIILAFNIAQSSPRRNSKAPVFTRRHSNAILGRAGTGTVSNVATASGNQQLTFPGHAPTTTRIHCTQEGFFPTPGSCLKFHRCVDFSGKGLWFSVFHFNCPVGTVFDPVISVCNHPWAVTSRSECSGVVAPAVTPAKPVHPKPPQPTPQVVQTTYRPVQQTTQPLVSTDAPISPTSQIATESNRPSVTEKPTGITFPDDHDKPIICFRDTVYRVHPTYCNIYYYCVDDEVTTFTCPPGLVFDSTTRSCSRNAECKTKIAPLSVKPIEIGDSDSATITESDNEHTVTTVTMRPLTVAPTTTESSEYSTTEFSIEATTTLDPGSGLPEETTTEKVWEISPDSLYDCGAPGYYPFEGDCVRFYKCVETEDGKLTGLLYKCPPRFGYSEEKKRCEREELLPTCQRVSQTVHNIRLDIETATPLYTHDLMWFFNN